MWRKETSSDGLGDEIVGAECSVLRSGLPVGMFRFSRRSLFKLRCQPTPAVQTGNQCDPRRIRRRVNPAGHASRAKLFGLLRAKPPFPA